MTLYRDIVVSNKLGLHARAASKLVTLAAGFAADVRVSKGPRRVNGKSIMGLLMLAAALGTTLRIEADGADAAAALDAIEALFEQRFGEDA